MNQIFNKKEPAFKHNNLVKGYNYERRIWDILDLSGIDYEGNPIIFEKWKRYTNRGYDILVSLNGYLRVECKFTSKPIFHSWFMRDWYSRDCDIIVTNNVSNVPLEDRQLLKKKGIELLETYQFCHYLKELKNAIYGNKYVIFEYSNSSLFNGIKKRIRRKYKERLKKIRKYVKTRLKRLSDFIKFMFWLEYEIKSIGGIVCIPN